MKSLLMLVAVLAAGGAGYEFYEQQVAQADYLEKRQADVPQIAQLKAENQQLHEANNQATRELSGAR